MKISIVIPCRNEVNYIKRCVESIAKVSLSENELEVFVVDGMSDDGTRLVLAGLIKKYEWLQCIDNPIKVTPVSLNLGIKNSTGELIMILGAHSELQSNFLSEVVPLFSMDDNMGCVGALLKNISEDDITGSIAAAMSSSFGMGNAHFRTGAKDGFVDTVAFGVYKKEVFEKAGLFDEELVRNQDDEFNYRVLKAGYKIYLTSKTTITYYVRSSYSKLFKQFFQYGYWKVYVNKKHKNITTLRQVVPFLFVGYLVLGFALHIFFNWMKIPFISGVFLYLMAALFFAFRISATNAAGIFYSFLIVHFAYGIGYWKGVIDFLLLRKKPMNSKTGNQLTR